MCVAQRNSTHSWVLATLHLQYSSVRWTLAFAYFIDVSSSFYSFALGREGWTHLHKLTLSYMHCAVNVIEYGVQFCFVIGEYNVLKLSLSLLWLLGDSWWSVVVRGNISNELGKTWSVETNTGCSDSGCVEWNSWCRTHKTCRVMPAAGWDC